MATLNRARATAWMAIRVGIILFAAVAAVVAGSVR